MLARHESSPCLMKNLDALLASLTETPASPVAGAPAMLGNLREYLLALMTGGFTGDLLVGCAAQSQGAALTGIPFTCEFLLRADAHPFLSSLRPRVQVRGLQFEQASYDLWMALAESPAVPALWQLFPAAGAAQDAAAWEREAQRFALLLRVLKPKRLFAWGHEARDFLGRHFPDLVILPLTCQGSSWHEASLRLELEWHGIISPTHEEPEVPRGRESGQLYLQVLPRLNARQVGGFGPEATQKRGVAAAGVLDEIGRLTLFRPGQSAALARRLRQARVVVGYNCLDFDYPLIRGETRFRRPLTLDLMHVLQDVAGHRVSLRQAVQQLLGVQSTPAGVDMQKLALQGEWLRLADAMEENLKLLVRLLQHLETNGRPEPGAFSKPISRG